jgi:hypothetical protein
MFCKFAFAIAMGWQRGILRMAVRRESLKPALCYRRLRLSGNQRPARERLRRISVQSVCIQSRHDGDCYWSDDSCFPTELDGCS